MVTLSKVEVFSAALLCAHTDKPSRTLLGMVTLIWPTCVQVTPLVEVKPVKVFPERTSRTHCGATRPAICASCTALAPVERRYCMLMPWPGVTNTCTKAELDAMLVRNMTPLLAQALVFCWLATRAVMVKFPARDSET